MHPLTRPEAAPPLVHEIVTGQFRHGPHYDNYRAHGTSDYLLIATLAGGGRYTFVDGALTTQVGDLTLYSPHSGHDYATEPTAGTWELAWAHFRPRPHWHAWLSWPLVAPGLGLLRLEDAAPWREVVAALRRANRAVGSSARQTAWAMHNLEEALLRCDALNPQSGEAARDPRVQDALDYLGEHLAAPLTLNQLAQEVGLSPSRLSHLFRAQMGVAPLAYREAQRLERAAQLLRLTSLNVEEVGREVGFADPFYFSARFKRRYGVPPREFRRNG